MAMECYDKKNLFKKKLKLCTDENNQPIYDSQGSLIVFDMTNGKLIPEPVSEESLAFFGLQQIDNDKSESFNLESSTLMSTQLSVQHASCKDDNANSTLTSTQLSIQHASWKDNNVVRRLIYAWKEYENEFKNGKCKSSEVWKKIAIVLQNENSQWVYTGMQCENKFKELRKKYVKVKDHNEQSGNSPMTCKFYEELEDVLRDKPYVQPVALASNLKKRSVIYSSQDSETENGSGKDECGKKKIRKTRVQRELGEWSTTLREDARRREEAKEKRHKDLVAASDRAVTIYKEMMEKLIDKL